MSNPLPPEVEERIASALKDALDQMAADESDEHALTGLIHFDGHRRTLYMQSPATQELVSISLDELEDAPLEIHLIATMGAAITAPGVYAIEAQYPEDRMSFAFELTPMPLETLIEDCKTSIAYLRKQTEYENAILNILKEIQKVAHN